jgi:hypothetical protein
MWLPVPKGYHTTIKLTRRYIMVTLSRTKGQPIATPALGEIKVRKKKEGFHNRLAHALWKMSFQLGFWPPPGFSDSRQLEFRHANALTPREKARLEADLKGLF